MVGCLFRSEIDQNSMPLSQKRMNVIVFTLTYLHVLLLQLLYIELLKVYSEFLKISACDVITADYTIIMSRSQVIMSCMTAVHDL